MKKDEKELYTIWNDSKKLFYKALSNLDKKKIEEKNCKKGR